MRLLEGYMIVTVGSQTGGTGDYKFKRKQIS